MLLRFTGSGVRGMLHQHVFPLLSQELAENVDIGEGIGIGVAVHRKMRMRTLCLVFVQMCELRARSILCG